jgi:hypothetical protein
MALVKAIGRKDLLPRGRTHPWLSARTEGSRALQAGRAEFEIFEVSHVV